MDETESKSWLEKRTRMEKYFFVGFSITAIVFVMLIIALSCQSGDCANPKAEEVKSEKYRNNSEYCTNSSCIQAANDILESINADIDPCEDFYQFACGNAIKKIVIPEDKQYVDVFGRIEDEVQQQLRSVLESPEEDGDSRWKTLAKKFYKACMNEDLIEKEGPKLFTDLFEEVGGWPVLEGDSWKEDDYSWMNLSSKFRKKGLDTNYFVQFSVTTDSKNTSKRSIELDQPSAFGLAREFLIDGKYINIYLDFMINVAVQLGANRSFAEMELKKSLDFESKLANISLAQEERRNYTLLYNPMTVKELQQAYPKSGNWLKYLNELLPSKAQIKEDDTIVVVAPQYLVKFDELSQTSKREQANYAMWRVMQDLIKYAPNDLYDHLLKALKAITGEASEKSKRWKVCTKEISEDITYSVASMYVRKYFDEDAKKTAQDMTDHIRTTFKSILKNLDWMDTDTRKKALLKADKIEKHVGYPNELLNDSVLNNYYEKLEINENAYLQSYLNICIHAADFIYSRLREPVDKHDWINHGESYEVGAYYLSSENSIQLPAGILQGTFFNKNRPAYLNFGAIGSIIAHEITHGFDDQGRQLDEDGNLRNWWASDTESKFLNKAQCIINQYGKYKVEAINETVNGNLTQGENIADNGGIKQAYIAYKSWVEVHGKEEKLPGLNYTPHQLFWISAAMNWCAKYQNQYLEAIVKTDSHSPNPFRVLGPFSNSKEFSEDFSCNNSSKMNPVDKCSVW